MEADQCPKFQEKKLEICLAFRRSSIFLCALRMSRELGANLSCTSRSTQVYKMYQKTKNFRSRAFNRLGLVLAVVPLISMTTSPASLLSVSGFL